MSTIVLRSQVSRPLSNGEIDSNFNNLNTDKVEATDAVSTNTASKVVRRDENGDFSAGVISCVDLNSSSDIGQKTNITDISNALSIVEELHPIEFNWILNGNKSAGVLAQELEQVLPHLVSTGQDNFKTVNYLGIIAYLIKAIQELNQKIIQLSGE